MTEFDTCLIDGRTRREIKHMYREEKTHNRYYLAKFIRYLTEVHGIGMKEYCVRYGGVEWPKCLGTGEDVNYDVRSKEGLVLRLYVNGRGATNENSEAVRRRSQLMSDTRSGMPGKSGWAKGLTADTDSRVALISAKRKGVKRSAEARKRMSDRKREFWSNATPEKREEMGNAQRVRNARARASGSFDRVTSIHRRMKAFLDTLSLIEHYVEECQETYYTLDFAFPQAKLAIECDGDYFHCNPLFYPNGPRTATQARNVNRETFRSTFLAEKGWTVLHFWECDINAGSFKDALLCRLNESGLLSPSV